MSAGTEVNSSTKDELLPSAPLAANPVLAAVHSTGTAMQEIMNIVEMDYANGVEISMKVFYQMLSKGLKKERQQIQDAFDNGQANFNPITQYYKNGNEYFNDTFKN